MSAFIWTVVVVFAASAAATCWNLARGVELSTSDRALSASCEIVLAVWGVYVLAGGIQ